MDVNVSTIDSNANEVIISQWRAEKLLDLEKIELGLGVFLHAELGISKKILRVITDECPNPELCDAFRVMDGYVGALGVCLARARRLLAAGSEEKPVKVELEVMTQSARMALDMAHCDAVTFLKALGLTGKNSCSLKYSLK